MEGVGLRSSPLGGVHIIYLALGILLLAILLILPRLFWLRGKKNITTLMWSNCGSLIQMTVDTLNIYFKKTLNIHESLTSFYHKQLFKWAKWPFKQYEWVIKLKQCLLEALGQWKEGRRAELMIPWWNKILLQAEYVLHTTGFAFFADCWKQSAKAWLQSAKNPHGRRQRPGGKDPGGKDHLCHLPRLDSRQWLCRLPCRQSANGTRTVVRWRCAFPLPIA
jgi:hypothetical protein